MSAVLADQVSRAMKAGAEELLRGQRPDGAFTDHPPASVLGTAGAITALHAADPDGSATLVRAGAAWLRANQHDDGGWGGVVGAGSELVATAVAVAALEITAAAPGATDVAPDVAPDVAAEVAGAVAAGRERLAALGGVAEITDPAIAVLCQQFLAMAGFSDAGTPRRLPLEVVLVDRVRRQRVSFRTAPFVGLSLMQDGLLPAPGPLRRATLRPARRAALRLLESIHSHEGGTGAFSEDPWPAALVCLGLARSGEAPHLASAIVGFLRRCVRPDGSWDAVANLDLTRSAYAATALISAGYADDPRLARTRELFHACQQAEPFPVFGVPAGGWSFSGPRGWPVTLESAEILSALAGYPDRDTDEIWRAGLDWLTGRQDSRGSWSLWVRDTKLANDGPCPAITSQAIMALCESGYDGSHAAVAAAARWLLTQQRPDGTFENLWYRDFTSGTSVVLAALSRAGHGEHPVARRARDWLLRTQRADGSWGAGVSGSGSGSGGAGAGSVEETAWAVHGLLGAGEPADSEPVRRGVGWLLAAQQPDGSWPSTRICVYIRHHMHYPNGVITRGLALRALAEYRHASTREHGKDGRAVGDAGSVAR